jgi:hypothetical protein
MFNLWLISTLLQDDGTPAPYDLPAPQSATALLDEKIEDTTEPKKEGELDDDARWARDRTGWAPRFVHEETQEERDETTLLDHQTFLEGKLDDKFFGGRFSRETQHG